MAGLESLFIPYITYISRALRGDRNDLMTSVVNRKIASPCESMVVIIGHCNVFWVPTNIDNPESNSHVCRSNDHFCHLHLVNISGGRRESGRWVLINLLLPD